MEFKKKVPQWNQFSCLVRGTVIGIIALSLCVAQELPGDWSTVQLLSPGLRVRLIVVPGGEVRGRLVGVSQSGIDVNSKGSRQTYPRHSVTRVWAGTAPRRGRGALIGAAVGAGAGTAVGGWMYSKGDFVPSVILATAVIGAGIGAAIGAVTGGRGSDKLVYAAYPAASRR
ncbi:MAG: hypothetical protein IT168_08990 [Bryobacterales bacterium]|nr:hypothetical protein [Bryobacterales bacterium]